MNTNSYILMYNSIEVIHHEDSMDRMRCDGQSNAHTSK